MHLRLTSLAFVILVPASAAVPSVHNLLTDATPESAAAAAMRAYGDLATRELLAERSQGDALRQFSIPRLEPVDGKIEVVNLTDGVKGVLLREATVIASFGKHGACPESAKTLHGAMSTSKVTQAPR